MVKYLSPEQYIQGTISAIPNVKRKRGNPRTTRNNRVLYKDCIATFDIETTRLADIEQSIMYVWQFHIMNVCTIIGRTWRELLQLFVKIRHELQGETLCIFVHNLSYEFQFLRAIYEFSSDEVFAVESRKVLKCTMWDKSIEFRCSYLHSNMSLSEYTKKMKVKHIKLSGQKFNYAKIRYPWTPLSEYEIEYSLYDVIGLAEAISTEMKADGDSLYTFPLTSTGYVRRDAKEAIRKSGYNQIKAILPSENVYTLLREAFRGGNTHANRFYTGRVLANVKSMDRSSSYPAVMCNCKYPISEFHPSENTSPEYVLNLMLKKGKAILCRVKIWGLRLRNEFWGAPYITSDKSRRIIKAAFDNGRILRADYLETTVTDIDFRIILSEYDYDNLEFSDVYYSRYGYLPTALIGTVKEYYLKKTNLKGVPGEEIYYMKAKNKLNSCYGMMAQDPVKQSIIFDCKSQDGTDWHTSESEISELLEQYNKKAFLAYQWGVWVTAHARNELEKGIRLAGENFVYCDTDSVKYLGDIDYDEYNLEKIAESKRSGAYATDPGGVTHYMGVFEDEGLYTSFATLGAKKYVYQKEHSGKTYCTIAGVNKQKGGDELDENGGIAAFRIGFVFRKAGGTESVYNDHPTNGVIEREGHKLLITPNIVIRDSEYTLGISRDYAELLTEIYNKDLTMF